MFLRSFFAIVKRSIWTVFIQLELQTITKFMQPEQSEFKVTLFLVHTITIGPKPFPLDPKNTIRIQSPILFTKPESQTITRSLFLQMFQHCTVTIMNIVSLYTNNIDSDIAFCGVAEVWFIKCKVIAILLSWYIYSNNIWLVKNMINKPHEIR